MRKQCLISVVHRDGVVRFDLQESLKMFEENPKHLVLAISRANLCIESGDCSRYFAVSSDDDAARYDLDLADIVSRPHLDVRISDDEMPETEARRTRCEWHKIRLLRISEVRRRLG